MRVEEATPEDWERVRDLRLAALEAAPDAYLATLDDEHDQPESFWRERLSREEMTTLVATARSAAGDDRDAGLATVGRSFDDAEVAGLYGVWVSPWARRRGVGDALIGAAIEHAADMGYPRLVLEVGDHNDRAIALYQRSGFEATGRTSRFPAPRDHITEHELALDLPVRPATD